MAEVPVFLLVGEEDVVLLDGIDGGRGAGQAGVVGGVDARGGGLALEVVVPGGVDDGPGFVGDLGGAVDVKRYAFAGWAEGV